jgi:AP-2 complex subunit alpha
MKKDGVTETAASPSAAPTSAGDPSLAVTVPALAPQKSNAAVVDLLGLDDLGAVPATTTTAAAAAATSPSMANSGISNASQSQINSWLTPLLDHPSGVLYEDAGLQIGLKAEYVGSKGRLSLFLGNKSQTSLAIDLALRPTNGLQCDLQPPVVTSLAVGIQLPQHIQIESTGLPVEYPAIQITIAGRPQPIQLRLPVPISKFFESIPMPPTDFMNRWRQIGGAPKEAQEMVKLGSPIQLATVRQMLSAVNLGLIDNCDPNPNNFVGVSVYHASQGKAGFLLRFECSPDLTAFRITVRSTSEALCGIVKNYLAERVRSL